ncbi:hypothetical protein [Anditalea andensis]|uniref:hypothetical protein n=1 Tax=Anditalea andensis TaxID=1048983 RepID=UPI0013DE8870|nr:hypothetical protein [Anditalea andensis]
MKITYLFFAFALIWTMGCNDQPVKETKTETVKVIEVEKAPVKEASETTISVRPNGGSVKTKKIDVKVETNIK